VVDPVIRAYHSVTGWLSSLWSTVTGWFGRTLASARNIASGFWNVGRDIVMGVIHGVEAYASWAWNKVVNFANGLLNAAKSFLGINSPSRLFRDTIGRGIPELKAAGRVAMASTPALAVSASAMQSVTSSSLSMIHAHVNVVAKVDGKVLFQTQQEQALQYQRRNSAPAFASA
jgi:hypothetical protein